RWLALCWRRLSAWRARFFAWAVLAKVTLLKTLANRATAVGRGPVKAAQYADFLAAGQWPGLRQNYCARQYCVGNRLKMLMYWRVHSAFSAISALSCLRS